MLKQSLVLCEYVLHYKLTHKCKVRVNWRQKFILAWSDEMLLKGKTLQKKTVQFFQAIIP